MFSPPHRAPMDAGTCSAHHTVRLRHLPGSVLLTPPLRSVLLTPHPPPRLPAPPAGRPGHPLCGAALGGADAGAWGVVQGPSVGRPAHVWAGQVGSEAVVFGRTTLACCVRWGTLQPLTPAPDSPACSSTLTILPADLPGLHADAGRGAGWGVAHPRAAAGAGPERVGAVHQAHHVRGGCMPVVVGWLGGCQEAAAPAPGMTDSREKQAALAGPMPRLGPRGRQVSAVVRGLPPACLQHLRVPQRGVAHAGRHGCGARH